MSSQGEIPDGADASAPAARGVRVAIVGAGPRGIHAVERLWAHAGVTGAALDVTVFDSRPPGEGAAYDVSQPDHVRLNVRSAIVDAGRREGRAPAAGWVLPFDAWRTAQGEAEPLEPFPPRALVGRYLAEVWSALTQHVPAGCRLVHERLGVESVAPASMGEAPRHEWVGAEAEPGDPALPVAPRAGRWLVEGRPLDEVLLATGHASDWPGALHHDWRGRERLVPAVSPVAGLDGDAVPPGSRVAVRGAALTFIDAAITLTEGRGGVFEAADDPEAAPAAAGQSGRAQSGGSFPRAGQAEPDGGTGGVLTYRRSGGEPAVIWPVTREGRWMEAKPQPNSATERLDLAGLRDAGRAAVRAAASDAEALEQVRTTAHAYLDAAGGDDHHELDAVFEGRPTTDATAALRRSLAVARGDATPHGAWAVGRAWRDLYPALVERFGGVDGDFAPFADAAARLERVAFGPPPVNAAKIVALIDAGLIDPASLDAASIDAGGLHFAGHEADVVIDAVLPPPGVKPKGATLPGALAEAALLARASGRRGLAIDPDGTCLAPDGTRLEGLAAVGRPTEDVTIGNDTLDRSLHPTIENWAIRVTDAAAAAARTAAPADTEEPR